MGRFYGLGATSAADAMLALYASGGGSGGTIMDPRDASLLDPESFVSGRGAAAASTLLPTTVPAGAPPPAELPAPCPCLLEEANAFQMRETGEPLSEADWATLAAQCAFDPALAAASWGAVAGFNAEACKPWYKRKMTWLVSGGILLGGLALWSFSR